MFSISANIIGPNLIFCWISLSAVTEKAYFGGTWNTVTSFHFHKPSWELIKIQDQLQAHCGMNGRITILVTFFSSEKNFPQSGSCKSFSTMWATISVKLCCGVYLQWFIHKVLHHFHHQTWQGYITLSSKIGSAVQYIKYKPRCINVC